MSLRIQNNIGSSGSKLNQHTHQNTIPAATRVNQDTRSTTLPVGDAQLPAAKDTANGIFAISVKTDDYNLQISRKAMRLYREDKLAQALSSFK